MGVVSRNWRKGQPTLATRPASEVKLQGSPFQSGMSLAIVPGGGGQQVFDLVTQLPGVFAGSTGPSWSDGYLSFPGGGAAAASLDFGANKAPLCRNLAQGPFTVMARVYFKGGACGLCERNDNNSVNAGWEVNFSNSAFGMAYVRATTDLQAFTGTTVPQNAWKTVAIATPGDLVAGNFQIYYDGVLQSLNVSTSGSGAQGDDFAYNMYVGRSQFSIGGGGAGAFNGLIEYLYIWKRFLRGDEIAALTRDPYQLFRPSLPVVLGKGNPAVVSLNPNVGQQGMVQLDVYVTGSNTAWVNGTSVASFSGTGITVNSTTVNDASHAVVNVTIAAGATISARDFTMTTGAATDTLAASFTVHGASSVTSNARVAFQFTTYQWTNQPGSTDLRRYQPQGIQIRSVMNNTPNQCTFSIDGQSRMPQVGDSVKIYDPQAPANLLFAGTIQNVEQAYEGRALNASQNPANTVQQQLVWKCTALDFSWLLNRKRPFGTYTAVSASDIVKDLVAKYASIFTTAHVQTNLATLTAIFDGTQDMATCFNNLANAIGGGHWYVDYNMDVHFFHVIPPAIPALSNTQQGVDVARAAAMTVTDGALIPNVVSGLDFWVTFASTFIYANGAESQLSYLSSFLAHDARYQFSISNLPIGTAVGGQTVTKRRIYYRSSAGFGTPGNAWVAFCDVNDNTTTSFTCWGPNGQGASSTAVIAVPSPAPLAPAIYVAPPAGASQGFGVAQSGTSIIGLNQLPGAPFAPYAGGAYNSGFTPGSYVFKVTGVYADGTESLPSAESNVVVLDGAHSIGVTNLPTFPSIGTLNCIGRIVYASLLSSANLGTYKDDWAESHSLAWGFVPDNTSTNVASVYMTGPLPWNKNVPPVNPNDQQNNNIWPHQDGPSLENYPAPDALDGTHSTLLQSDRGQMLTSTMDLSQVRNRVFVRGAGSSLKTAALASATTLAVADISAFDPGGGKVLIAGYGAVPYIGVSGPSGAGTVFLNPANALTAGVPQGAAVDNWFQVDDVGSQQALSILETDVNGNPTDGVHEYTVVDTTLRTQFQLYVRGYAELELFARPIVTIRYSTLDSKTRVGINVHCDLSNPPLQGDFLIQDVTIDHVHDEADLLSPIYTVTASSVKYNLSDLLLSILANTTIGSSGSGGNLAGIVPASSTAAPAGTVPPATSRRNWAGFERTMNDVASAYTGGQFGLTSIGLTVAGTMSTTIDDRRVWGTHTTSAQGSFAGVSTTTNPGVVRFSWKPYFAARVRTGSSLTAVRVWIGWFRQAQFNSTANTPPNTDANLFNQDASQGGDGASNSRCLAFRFSPLAASWMAVVSDGLDKNTNPPGAGSGSITAVGPQVNPNVEYLLEISVDPAAMAATFTVTDVTNNGSPQAIVVPMPSSLFGNPYGLPATNLGEHIYAGLYSNDGNNKSLDVGGVYLEWGLI